MADRVHHDLVEHWFAGTSTSYPTCPLTQGALIRTWLRAGATAADAVMVLASVTGPARHEFWPDELPYTDVELRGVVGHRQVTGAYLAALARSRGGQLVTLDRALTVLHPGVAVALDVSAPPRSGPSPR